MLLQIFLPLVTFVSICPNMEMSRIFFEKDGVKMIYSEERNQKVYLYKSGEKRQYFADGNLKI